MSAGEFLGVVCLAVASPALAEAANESTQIALASPTAGLLEISPEFLEEQRRAEEELQIAQEQQRLAQEDRERRLRFFWAIASNDKRALCAMLNGGIDPDCEFPVPAPKEFERLVLDEHLRYYLASEPGFTPLMLASALGNQTFVKFLLLAGANPAKTSKRHRTHALWLAAKTRNLEIMRALMGITPLHVSNRYRITVSIASQEASLWRDGKLEFVTPISSGSESHPTPRGKFLVTDKHRTWRSTLYPASMPYFLRLSCGDFGLHWGPLPGYPASHGCIRLPEQWARRFYTSVPIGTLVEIR